MPAVEAWSGIGVQLIKHYYLIPNIVGTVKGYASDEKESFENVAVNLCWVSILFICNYL